MRDINKFISELNELPINWEYFVDFNKTFRIDDYSTSVNLLNTLLSFDEKDIESELLNIINKDFNVVYILFMLLAIRTERIKNLNFQFDGYLKKFNSINELNDKDILYIFNKTGLKDFFLSKSISNLSDYLKGIEVGLDTNGRKNRNGKSMEENCYKIIKEFCIKNSFTYIKNKKLSSINLNKVFDFILYKDNIVIAIEVNSYNSSGSKLISISKEYTELNKILKDNDIIFVWVTNGLGWASNKNMLKDNIVNIEHFVNYKMLSDDYLNTFLDNKEDY